MSISIRISNLSFSYTDAVPLFSDVDLHVEAGWTGLVGANGSGKSTLLRLIAGTLHWSEGRIQCSPDDAIVRLCPQEVGPLGDEVRALAAAASNVERRILGQLRLDPPAIGRWRSLSPGERKRWQIGAALATEPDVLLLDEPTNHLDAEARDWLIEALRRFPGIGWIVSHDRELLERLPSAIVRLHGGAATLWRGSYSQAQREWEGALDRRVRSREQAQDELRRARRQVDQTRRIQEAAARNQRPGRRMKSKHDSDARSMEANVRADWAVGSHGKRVANASRRSADAEAAVERIEIDKEVGRSVFVGYERSPKPWIASIDAPQVLAGDLPILGPVRLQFGRESRVHLAGPNGAGKTTLLEELLRNLHVPADRVLSLPQEIDAHSAAEAFQAVQSMEPGERGRLLSLVAALGVDPARLLSSASPSPGETRKLLLAIGLARHVWALVLDEPTNHLDLPSIERLEAALAAYPGALLLVTHDDALARACTTERWEVQRVDGAPGEVVG